MDWTPVMMVSLSFAVMIMAAWADWRTREASDLYWVIIGGAGMVFLAADMLARAPDALYFLFLVPIAVFFLDIFWERKGMLEGGVNLLPLSLYLLSFIILGFLAFQFNQQQYFWQMMVIPIMFLVFILLYQLDVIKGGADAKALIALSIMFPLYPVIDGLPLISIPFFSAQYIMPFPLLILFNAALLTIAVPVFLLAFNAMKGDLRFPAMLFGYRMPVAEAREGFVWPMERIVDGGTKLSLFPKGEEPPAEQFDKLAAAGMKEVWVTPKLPFLIPITVSLLFSTVVGNLLFLLIR